MDIQPGPLLGIMIDILMSTYNGAEFLPAQLDSILGQDFAGFRLLIRDDGSGDETISIIKEYRDRDKRIRFLEDGNGNLGAPASFMALVEQSEPDFFMFADQDDVWIHDKISRTLAGMNVLRQKYGDETPLAVFTDLAVTDSNLTTIHESFWDYQKLDPSLCRDWKAVLSQNVAAGCTLMVNKAAKAIILPFALPEMMHDHWVAARVAKFGKIDYLPEPTVLYRQHSQNAEGAKNFGLSYAASKVPGLTSRFSFYRRAARVFGGTSALELLYKKLSINLKRL